MLNLAGLYWEWRNKPRPLKQYYSTAQGRTVRAVGGLWVVCKNGRMSSEYVDMRSPGFHWSRDSGYFNHCLATKEQVEAVYGKILGLPEETQEKA